MGKREDYRQALRGLDAWDAYLLRESGLPGPRGNIELGQAVADEGDRALFERLLAENRAEAAPTNTPQEFLAFCGALGLGRLAAEGEHNILPLLKDCANDPRWRMHEAVAMALQRLGGADIKALLDEMAAWSQGSFLEQRAAAAALAEPALLHEPGTARRALHILDAITASIAAAPAEARRDEAFRTLRKGMGYCWSVVVAALPLEGKPAIERWLDSPDPDVRWLLCENLKKNRLARMDAAWVSECLTRIS